MTSDLASALIVGKPGRMRDSLEALIASVHQIGTVDTVDNGLLALKRITTRLPTLLLFDSNLASDETWTILKQIKLKWPQIHCIVLANNIEQLRKTKATGADGVLPAGLSAAQFFAAIEGLLSRQEI